MIGGLHGKACQAVRRRHQTVAINVIVHSHAISIIAPMLHVKHRISLRAQHEIVGMPFFRPGRDTGASTHTLMMITWRNFRSAKIENIDSLWYIDAAVDHLTCHNDDSFGGILPNVFQGRFDIVRSVYVSGCITHF